MRNAAALAIVIFCSCTGTASAQFEFGQALNMNGEQGLYQPFAELTGRAGGLVDGGEASLFLPLVQTESEMLFADIRGKVFDDTSSEGNWGLGYRGIMDNEWILGAYGFYDLRETAANNNFQQGVFGLEAMTYEYEVRANAYLGEGGAQNAGGPIQAMLTGNQILISGGGQERAYSGLDFEAGALLWTPQSNDIELRAYAGGFYFDNDAVGFPEVAGPRARVELRLYDLDLLGDGSRVVLGGTVQHDDVRDTQGIASLQVRIPFGKGGHRPRLSPLQRRMLDPIQRDVDIVTQANAMAGTESTLYNGNPTGFVAQTNAVGLAAENPAGVDTLLVTGEGGTGTTATPIVVRAGQNIIGGGQTIMVQGASSGRMVPFVVPGTRPTIAGSDLTQNVFQLGNNSSLTGFDITGGRNGIFGADLNGFEIANNRISNADNHGVFLEGVNSGRIVGNTANENGRFGLIVGTLNDGTVSGNTANGNSDDGLFIITLNDGTVSGNTANENGGDGLFIITLNDGTVSGNTANENGGDGLFISTLNDGTVSGNTANENGFSGLGVGRLNDGTVSGNTATENGFSGLEIFTLNNGTVSGNTANENVREGLLISNLNDGTVSGNTANGNTLDGFRFFFYNGGDFRDNVANNNTLAGYNLPTAPGGSDTSNNTGSGNGSNNTYP